MKKSLLVASLLAAVALAACNKTNDTAAPGAASDTRLLLRHRLLQLRIRLLLQATQLRALRLLQATQLRLLHRASDAASAAAPASGASQ